MSTTTPISAPPLTPTRPNRWPRWLTPVLLVIAGVALGVAGVQSLKLSSQPTPKPAPASSESAKDDHTAVKLDREKWPMAGIKLTTVTPVMLEECVWRTGRVVLNEDRVAHVAPLVAGIVSDVRVHLGQDVKTGTVLAILESREVAQSKLEFVRARVAFTSERERASWSHSSAKNTADLVKAVAEGKPSLQIEVDFKNRPVGDRRQTLLTAYAHRNQLRAQAASQKASGDAVAEATLRKTEAECEAAEASLRALCEEFRFQAAQQSREAELKVKEAEAAFYAARTHLLILGYSAAELEKMNPATEGTGAARFEITAPFAGTIVEKHAVRSERVDPQVQLFRLADLSTVWVQADVFEADLPLLRGLGNRPIRFRAPVAGIPERTAEIIYSGDLVDQNSRALSLTASVANPDRLLKPGMYVEVGLPQATPRPVVQLPASAIQRHDGKTFVFVYVKDDEFRRADVEIGREGGDQVEIKTGLSPGDSVVVEGAFVLKSELFRDELVGE